MYGDIGLYVFCVGIGFIVGALFMWACLMPDDDSDNE